MKIGERHKAIELRKKGYSLKEIAKNLSVAKSSVSMWVRNVELSPAAEKRLLTKIKLGQFNAAKNKRAKTATIELQYLKEAKAKIKTMNIDKDYVKLLCAMIYWCEGTKDNRHGVSFINSDPHLMQLFIKLLRDSFDIDETKFRPLLHLHEYHIVHKEIDFWSKIININKKQFTKPYIKPHTGKRIRANYRGCLSLRYFSADLSRRLLAFGRAFLNK